MGLTRTAPVLIAAALFGKGLVIPVTASGPEVGPPSVDLQVVLDRDAMKRGETVTAFILVTNKSDAILKQPRLNLRGFGLTGSMPSLKDIPPYASERAEARLKAADSIEFGQHRLIFLLDYAWAREPKSGFSTQSSMVSVQVNRQFEEEAKGLPGGTAALFYLLLPIIPAFLAYEFVDSLRGGLGVRMPQFKTEHIVPAFLAAILFSYITLLRAKQDQSFAYANPTRFAVVLLVSSCAGAFIPSARWLRQSSQRFREDDGFEGYLRKALRQANDGRVQWARGEADGQPVEGVLLKQPNGVTALGARLQISPVSGKTTLNELASTVDSNGVVLDRLKLIKLVRDNRVQVAFQEKIVKGGIKLETAVLTQGIKDFQPENSEPKQIVVPVN